VVHQQRLLGIARFRWAGRLIRATWTAAGSELAEPDAGDDAFACYATHPGLPSSSADPAL